MLRGRARIAVAATLAVATAWPVTAGASDPPRFREVATEVGIDFTHRHFGTGEKYMPENMGAGVAVLDYDGDGRLDLYLVQGAPIGPGLGETGPGLGERPVDDARNRLYRQRLDGQFEDVTQRAGVGHQGYGMGVAVADVDADGDLDLFVTNFGPNVLYRNRGDGTFEDATAEAGVAGDGWSTGAGFFDADGDLDLDLFVTRYVDFSFERHTFCGDAKRSLRAYCHPDVYAAQADRLYRNRGAGTFDEASRASGIVPSPDAKGLGLAFGDFDDDGRIDVFVANDSTMNHLYLAGPEGRFEENALFTGVGFNGTGAAEAGMGVAVGDLDGDGRTDLFVTHLDKETNTLYRNLGQGAFRDATEPAGLAAPSLPWVGFGTVAFDHDLDGDLDLFVANGHIIDNIAQFDASRQHRQPAQLFDNQGGGRFVEHPEWLRLTEPLVGRGVATGDLDRDGDLDLVITQNGDRFLVLRNDTANAGNALGIVLGAVPGESATPHGWGTRVTVEAGRRTQAREAQPATSYLSQGTDDLVVGLGDATKVDALTVRGPQGRVVRFLGLPADAVVRLRDRGQERPNVSRNEKSPLP